MNDTRKMSLGAFLHPTGHHVAAWRHPGVNPDPLDFREYIKMAQVAESACFDTLFVADSVCTFDSPVAHRMARSNYFEPLTLLAALSAVTSRIGLIATATTSYNEPYHIARKFASLDHLSGGRAGWNLVTTDAANEAMNFGRASHFSHAERYLRAREFYQVVSGLWDSWDADAFINDKASGITYDPDKLHTLNYQGKYFQVRGPLNVARSPQGKPVVVQAGSSEEGKNLAAETAEVVFTAQRSLSSAQAFYQDVKGRMAKFGRHPDSLKIMPGVFIVTGDTQAQAQEKYEAFQALVQPEVGIALLGRMLGNFDLSDYDPNSPLPELAFSESGQKSRQKLLAEIGASEQFSLAELGKHIAGGRGHYSLIGTPEKIADELQAWFEGKGADGFNVLVPQLAGGLDDVVHYVIPELQRRGLFRTHYAGTTLRSHLGL